MQDSGTQERAEATMKKLGLSLPKKFEQDPESLEWPINISELNENQLAHHLSWWSGWIAYINPEIARAETNATAFRVKQEKLVAMEMSKRKGDFNKVTELKAAVSELQHIQELDIVILEADAIKKLLQSLLAGYENRYKTVSREITRRENENKYVGNR